MAASRCPTCGADLDGRPICVRCGTLAGLEFKVARVQSDARNFVRTKLALLSQNLRPHHFLWACAVMPIFLLPPLVSLIIAIGSMRRDASRLNSSFEWIGIISAMNLILSALILHKFHYSPTEIYDFVLSFLAALMHIVTRHLPGAPQPPLLTPI